MPTFVGLPIPWEHCQAELGIKFAGDYAILSSIFTLGMWRFTPYDTSNITPYVITPYGLPSPFDSDMAPLLAIGIYVALQLS